jgi:hypothetical protein
VGNPSSASIPEDRFGQYSEICLDYSSRFWTEIDLARKDLGVASTTPNTFMEDKVAAIPYVPDDIPLMEGGREKTFVELLGEMRAALAARDYVVPQTRFGD